LNVSLKCFEQFRNLFESFDSIESTLGIHAAGNTPAFTHVAVSLSIAVEKRATFADWLRSALPNWWLGGRVSRVG